MVKKLNSSRRSCVPPFIESILADDALQIRRHWLDKSYLIALITRFLDSTLIVRTDTMTRVIFIGVRSVSHVVGFSFTEFYHSGASCSGKTTLAKHLNRILPDSVIIHQDVRIKPWIGLDFNFS